MFLISKFTLSFYFKTKLGLRYCSRACICFSPQHTASWQYCITGQQGCHNISADETNHLSARTLCIHVIDSNMIAQIINRQRHLSTSSTVIYWNSPHLQQLPSGSANTVLAIYLTESSPYILALSARHTYYTQCAFLSKSTQRKY